MESLMRLAGLMFGIPELHDAVTEKSEPTQ